MNSIYLLEKLISITAEHLRSYIEYKNGYAVLIDPVDNEVIREHYAETHCSAGLILYGRYISDKCMESQGISMLQDILLHWENDIKLPNYHFDFNNFALCLIDDEIKDDYPNLSSKIHSLVLKTPDSNHNTTNWLPMRFIVNMCRYKWTKKESYKEIAKNLIETIKKVIYEDGFIDDRSPKGTSFNLQYNISTLATLILARPDIDMDFNFQRMIGALFSAILPDQDINYLGRGCNQIFGWGPWIYILSVTNNQYELVRALEYLDKGVPDMLKNNNILLNNYNGADKYLWWDYHYASVYTAHFFLWIVLALRNAKKQPMIPEYYGNGESGVNICKEHDYCLVVFNGRKEYLSEKGPVISALWLKKYGIVFKGGFGPWRGLFGNEYAMFSPVVYNHFGLIEIKNRITNNKIIRKVRSAIGESNFTKLAPVFPVISFYSAEGVLKINLNCRTEKNVMINLPIFKGCGLELSNIKVYADDQIVQLRHTGSIFNQYCECELWQSSCYIAKKWKIEIDI